MFQSPPIYTKNIKEKKSLAGRKHLHVPSQRQTSYAHIKNIGHAQFAINM